MMLQKQSGIDCCLSTNQGSGAKPYDSHCILHRQALAVKKEKKLMPVSLKNALDEAVTIINLMKNLLN